MKLTPLLLLLLFAGFSFAAMSSASFNQTLAQTTLAKTWICDNSSVIWSIQKFQDSQSGTVCVRACTSTGVCTDKGLVSSYADGFSYTTNFTLYIHSTGGISVKAWYNSAYSYRNLTGVICNTTGPCSVRIEAFSHSGTCGTTSYYNTSYVDFEGLGIAFCPTAYLNRFSYRNSTHSWVNFVPVSIPSSLTYSCNITASASEGGVIQSESTQSFINKSSGSTSTNTWTAGVDISDITLQNGNATCVLSNGTSIQLLVGGLSECQNTPLVVSCNGESWFWVYIPESYIIRSWDLRQQYNTIPVSSEWDLGYIGQPTSVGFRYLSQYSYIDYPLAIITWNWTTIPAGCAAIGGTESGTIFNAFGESVGFPNYTLAGHTAIRCNETASPVINVVGYKTWLDLGTGTAPLLNTSLTLRFVPATLQVDNYQQFNYTNGTIGLFAIIKYPYSNWPSNSLVTCNVTATLVNGTTESFANQSLGYITNPITTGQLFSYVLVNTSAVVTDPSWNTTDGYDNMSISCSDGYNSVADTYSFRDSAQEGFRIVPCPGVLQCSKVGRTRTELATFMINYIAGDYLSDIASIQCQMLPITSFGNAATSCDSVLDSGDWESMNTIKTNGVDNAGYVYMNSNLAGGWCQDATYSPSYSGKFLTSHGAMFYYTGYMGYNQYLGGYADGGSTTCGRVVITNGSKTLTAQLFYGSVVSSDFAIKMLVTNNYSMLAQPIGSVDMSDPLLRIINAVNRSYAQDGDDLVADIMINGTLYDEPKFYCYVEPSHTRIWASGTNNVVNGTYGLYQYLMVDFTSRMDYFDNSTEDQYIYCRVDVRTPDSVYTTYTNNITIQVSDPTDSELAMDAILSGMGGLVSGFLGGAIGMVLGFFISNPVGFSLIAVVVIIAMPIVVVLMRPKQEAG